MALTQCTNCGKEISDKATIYPNCDQNVGAVKTAKICENCGNVISNDGEPCPNCGCSTSIKEGQTAESPLEHVYNSPVSSTSKTFKHTRIKAIAATAAVIAIVVVAILLLFFHSDTTLSPIELANQKNGGKFAYDAKRLYFVESGTKVVDNSCVYSTTLAGTDKQVLIDDDYVYGISVLGKDIYYLVDTENSQNSYALCRMDQDGSNQEEVITMSSTIYGIYGSRIYYLDGMNALHSCSLGGSDDILFSSEPIYDFCIGSNKIYAFDGTQIFSMSLKGESKVIVCNVKEPCDPLTAILQPARLIFDNGTLFFCNAGEVYSISTQKIGQPHLIATPSFTDGAIRQYAVVDDNLYYVEVRAQTEDSDGVNNRNLYRVNKTGGDSEKLLFGTTGIYFYPDGAFYQKNYTTQFNYLTLSQLSQS